MIEDSLAVVVLAAGLGKRMGGDIPKACVQTREKALIEHVLEALDPLKPSRAAIVVGYRAADVEAVVRGTQFSQNSAVTFDVQQEQRGTGDAVRAALPSLEGFRGTVVITYADTPLVTSETLKLLVRYHVESKSTVTFLSFRTGFPNPYGRVVRDDSGSVTKIIEAKDCSAEQSIIDEVNSGIYAVDSAFLKPAIDSLENKNAQGEYYLTDIVGKAVKEGQRVSALKLDPAEQFLGVNSKAELVVVNEALQRRHKLALAESGVQFVDPATTYIDATVRIEPGAIIGPNTQLLGNTTIASGTQIEGTAYIHNSAIGVDTHIRIGCRMEDVSIGARTTVGPFAHLRPGSQLGEDVRIGNFVETKNAKVADGAKANHLTYLGDCEVGTQTNIGAGTITCNYDGISKKSKTTIGSHVAIGSNTALVAPVTVHDGASIGAGSVITKDVPADALAFTRPPMVVKDGWAKHRREMSGKKHG